MPFCVTKARSQEPSKAERACATDAGAIKQAAAIIQSEGVFIDSSPLGKAVASKQTQQTSSIIEFGSGALPIRTMICVRKSLRRALVETCSNHPESCDRDACRKI